MTVMKNKFKMSIGIGGPTIVMIFVVISLTTLGTLSLVTANSDLNLAEKTYASATNYYMADAKCEEMLSNIDSVLNKTKIASTSANYIDISTVELSKLADIKVVKNPDRTISANWSVQINPRQNLSVKLLIAEKFTNSDGNYKIASWKSTNNAFWNYEDYQIPFEDQIPSNN